MQVVIAHGLIVVRAVHHVVGGDTEQVVLRLTVALQGATRLLVGVSFNVLVVRVGVVGKLVAVGLFDYVAVNDGEHLGYLNLVAGEPVNEVERGDQQHEHKAVPEDFSHPGLVLGEVAVLPDNVSGLRGLLELKFLPKHLAFALTLEGQSSAL